MKGFFQGLACATSDDVWYELDNYFDALPFFKSRPISTGNTGFDLFRVESNFYCTMYKCRNKSSGDAGRREDQVPMQRLKYIGINLKLEPGLTQNIFVIASRTVYEEKSSCKFYLLDKVSNNDNCDKIISLTCETDQSYYLVPINATRVSVSVTQWTGEPIVLIITVEWK